MAFRVLFVLGALHTTLYTVSTVMDVVTRDWLAICHIEFLEHLSDIVGLSYENVVI